MRTAGLLGLAVVLLWAWPARAEPGTQTITASEVMVRSGPSPEFYPTGKLRRGDAVRVVKEETTGWLAITPPRGSFSWINTRFVEQTSSDTAAVSAAEASIRVGSRLVNQEPTVERFKVTKGTILTIIGKTEVARDGTWLPIRPVPTEVRYIPVEAVRPSAAPQPLATIARDPTTSSATQATFTSPRPAVPGFTTLPAPANPIGSSSPTPPTYSVNPLWLQAEEAERAGDFSQAQALLEELAEQVKSTDHELWVRCLNRLQTLRDRRGDGSTAQPPTQFLATSNTNSGATGGQLAPWQASPTASPQRPRASSDYCHLQDADYRARLAPPVLNSPGPPPAFPGQWYEPGRLWRTAFFLDGRPAYRFEPINANRMWMYVTAGGNLSLDPYVGKVLYLYGTATYRGDLRTNYMAVLQVSPASPVR